MNSTRITPMILTYNEEDNIDRCLSRLGWAKRIVVIDSHSTDRTLDICSGYPAVEIHQRTFDDFANQCNFGLGFIETDFVLSIDADYLVPVEFVDDLEKFGHIEDLAGAYARFRYCVFGRPLTASLYPPRLVLYRRRTAKYVQDGHAHRIRIHGEKTHLPTHFDHDDRKPLSRWIESQQHYAQLEAHKLREHPAAKLSPADRVRRCPFLAVPLVAIWCLIVKRCLLDGRAGLYYTVQRLIAEGLLTMELMDRDLRLLSQKNK